MTSHIFPDLFMEVNLILLSVIIPMVLLWVRTKIGCISKIERRSFRQSKALILMANRMDDFKKINHPEGISPNFLRDIETELKDEHGNL